MGIFQTVFVYADKTEMLAELCAGGKQLGSQVCALVLGPKEEVDKAFSYGADSVYHLGELKDRRIEDYTETIIHLVQKEKPELILIRSSKRAKLIAGRLAAELKTSVLTDVMEFTVDNNELHTKRLVYGGAGLKREYSTSEVVVATVGGGVFEALIEDNSRKGNIVEVDFVQPAHPVRCIEIRKKESESVNLSAAKCVVGVGRGFAKQEDLTLAKDLANLIGAEVGCSRPIAEGENWLPKERYIGVSGAMVKPDVYVAIGISGQIQHMVGANSAKTIVAINKDKAAPIFKQADYGIVGDLYTVLPALIEKIKVSK
ncbi:electron transfer flavoprotein subunit alpha/FixB family protein [Dehalobacterium formicoaceticum]|uniref:FAD-binding protein n=1 Tax=Dehalobacterium formicoaceticum TaxID=51515 RepID=A0ABT1Y8R5_9FIRM|nr:FAD-binding protein [Dehalobacterium formicoaceticum]MCR6546953.1 FAD-binding protein [Dehalobacterium formicoaceticum]